MVWKVRWDPEKAESNHRKHGIRFEEAEAIFRDPFVRCGDDPEHSSEEDRFLAVGELPYDRLIVVSYTIRDDYAWLISARAATRAERRRYMRKDELRDRPVAEGDENINFDDIPEIHDFSGFIRGRHYIPMTITRVSIADDVARYFPDDESVNTALRQLIDEGRAPKPRDTPGCVFTQQSQSPPAPPAPPAKRRRR